MARILGYVLAAALVLLGATFVVAAAATGLWPRYVVGGVLVAAGLSVIFILRMKVPETKVEVTQNVELSGDMKLEEMKCRSCGANLSPESVTVKQGEPFAKCAHCGASYRIEEAPKW